MKSLSSMVAAAAAAGPAWTGPARAVAAAADPARVLAAGSRSHAVVDSDPWGSGGTPI